MHAWTKRLRMGRRRGTVMMETALVLPMLMLVLLLVIFLGHSMRRKSKVMVADRHFAWQNVKKIALPQDAEGNVDYDQLRRLHFDSDPVSIGLGGGSNTPRTARDGLVVAAGDESQEAGDYADDVVNHQFPGGQSYHVSATYPRDSLPLDRFGRQIADNYFREGVPWQHSDRDRGVNVWQDVRDHYVEQFDEQVRPRADGSELIRVVRNLYLRFW